ncbi:hypothetical protein AB0894_32840, partial [Streptomyces sp. NPDC047916]
MPGLASLPGDRISVAAPVAGGTRSPRRGPAAGHSPLWWPAITASLFARFASRQDDSPQMKMIAALRNQ